MKRVFIALLCFTCYSAFAQNVDLDSLYRLTESDAHDSIRAEAMADIVWLIKFSDSEKAKSLGRESIKIAQSAGNGRVESYAANNLGVVFWGLSEYDSAIHYLGMARDYYEQIGNERNKAVIMLNIALLYQNIPDYTKSLEIAFDALRVFESTKDTLYAASVRLNIGNVYFLMEEYENALNSYRSSWSLRKRFGAGFGENRQRVLLNLGNTFLKLEQLDSAEYYLKESQKYAITVPDYKNLALSNSDLGKVYSARENDREALLYFGKAAGIYRRSLISSPYDQAGLYVEMSRIHSKLSNLDSALFYAKGSMDLAEDLDNQALKKDAMRNLSDVLSKTGNYKGAYEELLSSINISDSLLSAEKFKQINELQTKYDTEKKEQQIELQQAELAAQEVRLQRNQIFVLALVIIVILVVIVFILWKNRTEKAYELERQEANLKLREAEINAVINSQEKERNRFARDLHDGFGQLISVLKLNLAQLGETSAKDAEKRYEVYKNGESVINEMYTELRNICFDLMPQTLVKRGLMPALKEFGAQLNKTDKINCEVLVFANNERLPELFEISLFRVTQEWVNNVLKYSGADHITIQLVHADGEITLTVEDNGNGFDPQLFFNGTGNGWKNIQTRLNQIKGDFDLDSRPGVKGTMMTVVVETTDIAKRIPTSTEEELTA